MYPDFTTSHAPDFVSNLLRIPRDYNEMANANARTQVAQREQATRQWIAQINAEQTAQAMALAKDKDARDAQKFALDIKFAPDEEARKAALAAESIEASKANRSGSSYRDMLAKTHADVAAKSYNDQLQNETAIKDMNADLAKLQPYEYAGQEGLDLMNKYAEKFTDPTIAPKVYHNWADTRQDYRNAQDRTLMDPDALNVYKEAVELNKLDEGQAMSLARQKQAEIMARQEAQKQVIIEQAKQAAKPDAMSPAEERAVEFYVGRLPKNVSEKDLTPQQRALATAKFSNLVFEARSNNGHIDDSKVPGIWDEVLKNSDYKSQLDQLFPKTK